MLTIFLYTYCIIVTFTFLIALTLDLLSRDVHKQPIWKSFLIGILAGLFFWDYYAMLYPAIKRIIHFHRMQRISRSIAKSIEKINEEYATPAKQVELADEFLKETITFAKANSGPAKKMSRLDAIILLEEELENFVPIPTEEGRQVLNYKELVEYFGYLKRNYYLMNLKDPYTDTSKLK